MFEEFRVQGFGLRGCFGFAGGSILDWGLRASLDLSGLGVLFTMGARHL